MRVGIVAGEPSGDLLAAGLLTALRRAVPDLQAEGIGGPHMMRAGFTSLFPMDRLSFMGSLQQLATRLAELWQMRRRLCEHFLAHRPDLFIGVDAPDFNLGLEEKLHAGGLRTVHYVSPSVWAWRRYRVRQIARAVDRLLLLFPFEEEFYQGTGVNVRYVGHPLADRIRGNGADLSSGSARAALGMPADGRCIALLPGSRAGEMQRLTRPFLETAAWCHTRMPGLRFAAALVSNDAARAFLAARDRLCPGLPLRVYSERTPEVLRAADAALIASGTAALESLLLGCPMVVSYRLGWPSYALASALVSRQGICLPNLLAQEELVPVLLQHQARPDQLGPALLHWLDTPPAVAHFRQRSRELLSALGRDVDQRAAAAVLELLEPGT